MDTRKPLAAHGVVGVVLAGGRSRRFGVDKARVVLGGEALVVRTARTLGVVLGEVVIVGDTTLAALWPDLPGPRLWRPQFMDDPREGPLGAVLAAWRRFSRPLVVLACDLPLIDEATVARLARPTVGARVPELPDLAPGGGGPRRQWLCAHYGAEALHVMATAWDEGERSMGRAVGAAVAAGIALEDEGGWDPRALGDVDTPEALDALLLLEDGLGSRASGGASGGRGSGPH